MGQLLATQDVPAFILGFCYTILALAVLHAVFLYSQTLATGVLNGFLSWGQQVSGESPTVLTPSGIAESGLQLARVFWSASGHASWFVAPLSALEDLICTAVIVVAFGIAAIIYLLATIEAWVLIIGASVLLAFAALPWTWAMFPGWALAVLSACIKIFFLLCVLALGLHEATNWTAAMAATSGTLTENISLMMQATVEALLFVGSVYYLPNLMARLVIGAAGSALNAGEGIITDLAGATAGAAGGAVAAVAEPGAVGGAAEPVFNMLLR
jgi:type IV secretory pathway TrbL component